MLGWSEGGCSAKSFSFERREDFLELMRESLLRILGSRQDGRALFQWNVANFD